MTRIFAMVSATLLLIALAVGSFAVLTTGASGQNAGAPKVSATASPFILGPIDGSQYKSVKGGAVACPNHQPCGEPGQSKP